MKICFYLRLGDYQHCPEELATKVLRKTIERPFLPLEGMTVDLKTTSGLHMFQVVSAGGFEEGEEGFDVFLFIKPLHRCDGPEKTRKFFAEFTPTCGWVTL